MERSAVKGNRPPGPGTVTVARAAGAALDAPSRGRDRTCRRPPPTRPVTRRPEADTFGEPPLGASIGNGTIVLHGATLSAGIDTDVTIGGRGLIGPDARVLGGDGSAEIGRRATIGAGALVRGGLYGPRLTVGPGASLSDVEVGAGLIVGSGAVLGSRTSGGDDATVGEFADVPTGTAVPAGGAFPGPG